MRCRAINHRDFLSLSLSLSHTHTKTHANTDEEGEVVKGEVWSKGRCSQRVALLRHTLYVYVCELVEVVKEVALIIRHAALCVCVCVCVSRGKWSKGWP